MKKLKLKALDFQGAEVLTREQLKKILGGGMMGTTPGGTGTTPSTESDCFWDCTCNGGQTFSYNYCGGDTYATLDIAANHYCGAGANYSCSS